MIARRVVLKVNNSEYDILRFNYKFQRDIDAKGRPCSNYYGGEIAVMLESTDNIQLFQQMIHKDMPTVDGTIEVLSGDDGVCIRRIDFKEAYICSYAEQMQSGSGLPMFAAVSISPMRLDFNNNMLRLDRKWPRAKHGWQKLVEEEAKYVKPKPQALPTPLVNAVKGQTSALPNAEIEYNVTSYNINVSQSDKDRVKWVVEVDGKQEIQKQQGEKIKLIIKEEWIGKEINVMPYLKEPTPNVSVKTEVPNTKHYKVIPSSGLIVRNFDLPSQMSQYTINRRKTNEITIQRLEKKIPFHSAVVELGIKKITKDYNTRFNNGFPDDYYDEFGRYITALLIYKHQQIKLKAPIKEALNEVVKLLDSESGFNNGLGAPLFHIYENVVRKNDDTGFDKLLHFMFSAKHAYNLTPTISKSLGIAKELIKDEMYSWINDDEKGWDDLDMKANERGIEYGTELKSK